MPNPPKPAELKRKLGNPGKRAMPKEGEIMTIPGGYIEPFRPLDWAGKQLWDSVFKHGELWVSPRTDAHLLMMACEQLDRREQIRSLLVDSPEDRALNMTLNEIEKLIQSNLGQLGFSPAERTRLGLAEVKRQSKLEELMAKRDNSI
jgi:hypothetical protein